MAKSNNNTKYIVYSLLTLVILWVITYICFAFILMDLNTVNWTQTTRSAFIAIQVSILIIIIPISQIIKLEIN